MDQRVIALSTSSVGKNELLCKLRLLFFNSSSIMPASVRVNKPVSSYRGDFSLTVFHVHVI